MHQPDLTAIVATTPFRSEKNTNWEGAFRVPWLARWPGKIKPGSVSNEILSHHDWLPTLLAAAGMPDVMDRLKAGYTIGDRTYKVHIDGFNFLPYLTGQESRGPRPGFFYFSDDGDLLALRYDNWKFVFIEQRCEGTLRVWAEPFTRLRFPKLFNLRTDPFEHADVTSNTYYDWMIDHCFRLHPGTGAGGRVPGDVQGIPAAAEGGELHHRSGVGGAAAAARRLTMLRPPSAGCAPAEGGGALTRSACKASVR